MLSVVVGVNKNGPEECTHDSRECYPVFHPEEINWYESGTLTSISGDFNFEPSDSIKKKSLDWPMPWRIRGIIVSYGESEV